MTGEHNLNLSILSPEDPFAERVLIRILLLEKTKKYVLNHLPVTLLKHEMGLIYFGAVVGDSLK